MKYTDPLFQESVEFVKTLMTRATWRRTASPARTSWTGSTSSPPAAVAMFVGLLSDVGNWKAFSDKLGANNVGYFPTINFPDSKYKDQQVAQGAGIGYGVMTWSKNQKLAADYVKFDTTGEGARIYASATGALSPNTAVSGTERPTRRSRSSSSTSRAAWPRTTSRCSTTGTRTTQTGSATGCSSPASSPSTSSSPNTRSSSPSRHNGGATYAEDGAPAPSSPFSGASTMSHRRLEKDGIAPYLFLAPLLVLLAAFILYPVVMNLIASFTEWKGYGAKKWIGLANYRAMFEDQAFWTSIRNTRSWSATSR